MDLLESSKKILEKSYYRDARFQSIDTTYLFTTEHINEYLPPLKGKKVLSIASSGDHYFSILLNGALEVDLFDINYLSKPVIYLKKNGFEHLDFNLFCKFFGLYDVYQIFDYQIYEKFSKYLDDETYTYWNGIYDLTKRKGYSIYESDLIFKYQNMIEEVIQSNQYFQEEHYLKLRSILLKIKEISFIHSDINDLPFLLKKKYDVILCSNIQSYQNKTTYLKTIKKLSKFLNKEGEIYFAYLYHYPDSSQSDFYDSLLKSTRYTSKIITSKTEDRQDKVYIYKGK